MLECEYSIGKPEIKKEEREAYDEVISDLSHLPPISHLLFSYCFVPHKGIEPFCSVLETPGQPMAQ